MKKKVYNFIIVGCVIGIVACGIYIVPKLLEQHEAENGFEGLRSTDIDLAALHKRNKDIVGWIKIEGTRIDYPVMRTPQDPQFYLRRDFNKNYSVAGTPFMDSFSEPGETRNYLVYGHNMKSGTMFHDLTKYNDDFFKTHKYISFETLREGRAKYEIVAAFKTETYNFPYYHYADIKTKSTYDKYIEKVKNHNELSADFSLSFENDQLLTLSTCSYHVSDKSGRMVVVARKIDGERDLNPVWEDKAEKESRGVEF